MDGIRGRLTRGVAWIGLSRVAVATIGVASTLLLARLLTPEDFGLVAIATTLMAVVGSLTELSLSTALVQHADPKDEHFHTAFTLNALRSLIIGSLLIAAASPIADLYGDSRLAPLIVVVAFGSLIGGFQNPRLAALTRSLIFWQEFALSVSQKIAGFVVAAAIAFLFHSYWALVLGVIASQVLGLVLSYVLVPYAPRINLTRWRELFSFSVWLSLAQAVNTLNYNLDKLIVGYVLGPVPLGTYVVGDNLASMPTREVAGPIGQTLFPGFSRITDSTTRLRHAYQRSQQLICAIALPAGLGFAAMAQLLVPLAIGSHWTDAILVIQVIGTVMALQTLILTVQPLALALGETRVLFYRDLAYLVIRVVAVVAGMILWGLPGILFGRALSAVIGIGINLMLVQRLIGLAAWQQVAVNVRAFVSSGVMVAAVLAMTAQVHQQPGTGLVVTTLMICIAGALIYTAMSVILWWSAGRPDGPETLVADLAGRVRRRLGAGLLALGGKAP